MRVLWIKMQLKSWIRRALFIALISYLAIAMAMAAPPAKKSLPPIPVVSVKPQLVVSQAEIQSVGSLRAAKTAVLRAEIPGQIKRIHFKDGDFVKKDTLLITLDAAVAQAEWAEANAAYQLQQHHYQRAQSLDKKGVINKETLEQAQANHDVAKAQLTLAKAYLDKTQIKAPFAGLLGLKQVSEGDYLQQGQAIVVLADVSILELDFAVPQKKVAALSLEQLIVAKVDTYPERIFNGKILAFNNQLAEADRSLVVRAQILNQDGLLKPGMFATIRVLGEEQSRLWLPEEAIVPRSDQLYVYRVINNTAKLTPIVIGTRKAGQVEIKSGIAATDPIITAGQMKLTDGAVVVERLESVGPAE